MEKSNIIFALRAAPDSSDIFPGEADSNANLTRRMLMLLESRPFDTGGRASSQLVWNNVLANILERYFEQEVHRHLRRG